MSLFDDMNVFLVAVEAGSFSAAAQRLGVAKSVVSRRVSVLEDRLQGKLFERTTRGLRLTEIGEAYHDRTRRILGDVTDAENAVRSLQGELVGRLRVAAPLSFGQQHLTPVIAAFLSQHERVEIDLDLDDRQVDPARGGFDVVIRISTPQDSSPIARSLGPCRRVVCASPAYLAAHGEPRMIEDLSGPDHRFLIYGNRPVPEVWRFKVGGTWQVARLSSRRLTCNDGQALTQAAIEGLGLCVLPTFLASAPLLSGRLKSVMASYALSEASIHASWSSGVQPSAKAKALVEVLGRRFGPSPSWDAGEQPVDQPQRRARGGDRRLRAPCRVPHPG